MQRSATGIAILSFAHGHAVQHARVFRETPGVAVIGCWDDDRERGQRCAAQFGFRFVEKLDDLLGDPRVEAVTVTSETNRHRQLCELAAQAKKHILCYKPMATTLADCDAIIRAAAQHGVRLMIGHQMAFDPANQKMVELVASGRLGRISLVRRRHSIPVLLNESFVTGPSRWHLEPQVNVGMFFDDAVHATFFLHWLLGEPVSVTAEIANTITTVAPDDTGVAIFRFKSGAIAVLENSSVTRAGENTTEIYGERGTLIHNYGDAVSSMIPRRDSDIALKLYATDMQPPRWEDLGVSQHTPHAERIATVARAFVEMVRGTREPWPGGLDGRRAVEMCLGAYQATRSGRRVHFPLDHDGPDPEASAAQSG
jgi:predicted dehydrogenase